jgi:hypothetical protein
LPRSTDNPCSGGAARFAVTLPPLLALLLVVIMTVFLPLRDG